MELFEVGFFPVTVIDLLDIPAVTAAFDQLNAVTARIATLPTRRFSVGEYSVNRC